MTFPPLSAPQPTAPQPSLYSTPARAWTILLPIFIAVYFTALFSPALLDDADATHAQAAQHIATTGDWVTLYVNGIRIRVHACGGHRRCLSVHRHHRRLGHALR